MWLIDLAFRLLILGNSISINQPIPDFGWYGHWGMAASASQNDYAHQLQLRIAANTGVIPDMKIIRMDVPWVDSTLPGLKEEIVSYQADIAVVQMGDNARDFSEEGFYQPYRRVLEVLCSKGCPNRLILVGTWVDKPDAARWIKQLSLEYGAQFVEIDDLSVPVNLAWNYNHKDVAWHPNDRGMSAIAEMVFRKAYPQVFLPVVSFP